jgi:hypothetical protein
MMVSFIIPVRNDAENLSRCLESIAHLDHPGDGVEVVVIDNGSEDGSADVARRAGARVLSMPRKRVSALRNDGVREAKGVVLAFVDADHQIASGWLDAAIETLEARPDAAGVDSLCWPCRRRPGPAHTMRSANPRAFTGRVARGREPRRPATAFEAVGALTRRSRPVRTWTSRTGSGRRVGASSAIPAPGVHFGDPATLGSSSRRALARARQHRVAFRGPCRSGARRRTDPGGLPGGSCHHLPGRPPHPAPAAGSRSLGGSPAFCPPSAPAGCSGASIGSAGASPSRPMPSRSLTTPRAPYHLS